MSKDIQPSAKTSEKLTGLKTTAPKEVAAGLPAVKSSLQHILSEMPLTKGMKVLNKLNQHDGIDCPGCAWPDPDDERSRLGEYCENGAKAVAEEATSKKLTAKFFQQHSVQELAELSDYALGKKGRIAEPLILRAGSQNYEAISWDKAFNKIGQQLKSLDDPNEAIFYTSGRTSNEAAFLYQLFVRAYGTNNLPDCSNMCHESSGVALGETLGIGKGSVKLEDFYEAEVILILGQNPGTNHPRMLTALEKAKKNGAKIISVNPIVESGLVSFSHPQKVTALLGAKTTLTDLYLQVKINGDMALLQALTKLLLEEETKNPGQVIDRSFIDNKTQGVEDYLEHLKKKDLNTLAQEAGLTLDQIKAAVHILAPSKKIIACWAMGLTQHKNSVNTIKEVVNLLLLKGSIGKPGAGTCPVRGHSNVQGDRTMGIHERPPQRLLDALQTRYQFDPPTAHGYNVVEAIEAMHSGAGKVFFAMGGNFLSATPDTSFTAKALRKCALTVQVSTKLNRSHLVTGQEAIILPCLARTDIDMVKGTPQFVSVENSMGVVHSSRGQLTPISDQLLSEPEIVIRLAKATLSESPIPWDSYSENYDNIRTDIERCIPGFDNYNKRVREKGGFYLPNGARDNNYKTKTGKAHFTVSETTPIPLQSHEYLMMTVRSHDQFNTTIYGLDDRYRGILNERRVIMMNKKDMQLANLKEGALVDLYNRYGGVDRVAPKFIVVGYNIPQGCVCTYFPEANVLVPIKSRADKSHTPTSKSVVIEIVKRGEEVA
jgi:molybdopterin-dependent oxidoreductase alpha subunit